MSNHLLAVVLAAPVLLAQAPSVSVRPVEDLLPAGTYAMLHCSGLGAFSAATDEMPVAKLVRTFLERLPASTYEQHIGREMEQVVAQMRRGLGQVSLGAADVREVLRRPMALGIGRLTLRGMGPSVALLIDEGPAAPHVDKVLQVLERIVRSEFPALELSTTEIAGRSLRHFRHPQGPEFFVGSDRGIRFVSNSRGYLRDVFATIDGRQPGLAAASSLGRQRARLGATALAGMFLRTDLVLGTFANHLPYETDELCTALGVDTVAGVYAAAGIQDGRTLELFDIEAPGSTSGLLKAAFAGKADLRAARWCGQETVAFASLRCNVGELTAALQRLLDLLPQEAAQQARRGMASGMRSALRGTGITTQQAEELLHAVGDSVAVAVSLSRGALPLPELLLFLPVRDGQVVSAWLERLAGAAAEHGGVQWKTRQVGATAVRYCDVTAGSMALSPSFALAHGHLIVGSHTKVVVAALQREAADSLASADDFVAAAEQCRDAAALLHLRNFRLVDVGWRPFEVHVLSQLDAHAEEIGFDRDAVPEQEDFAAALGTITIHATVDEHGARFGSRGNLSPWTAWIAAGAVLDQLLLRAGSRLF